MSDLKLFRMELDYTNAKITTCCFADNLEEAEEFFNFKNGDKKPEVSIREQEIKKGCFLSLTHDIYNQHLSFQKLQIFYLQALSRIRLMENRIICHSTNTTREPL